MSGKRPPKLGSWWARLYIRAHAWITWPATARELKRLGWKRTGWKTWE